MDGTNIEYRTPGQLIAALLDQRGWSQRVLAVILAVDETAISKIINNERPVTADMALSLDEIFEVPADRFLALQRQYDLAQARIVAMPDPGRATRAKLFGGLPVTEMIRRGWLDANDVRDVKRVESELARFFGVASVEEIEILPHAAKKTNVSAETTPTQLAWLYRARQIATEMLVAPYSAGRMSSALAALQKLTLAAEEVRKVPRILAEHGIRFVIVEALPSSKIDGVCFWLDASSPVIAMSIRYDRIDNFWFVLRHEIEHVLQQHGKSKIVIDAELEGEKAGSGPNVDEEERLANTAAAEFCVPKKAMDSFIARKAPLFAERDLLGLAATLKVHPGLVAGQLHNRTGQFKKFRGHLVKVRSLIAPSAMVDGWGDVVPTGN